jgi:serine/threonine protein kinase
MRTAPYRLPLLRHNGIDNDSLLGSLKSVKAPESREGKVKFAKSRADGKLYVVKSVQHRSRSTRPNEARILGNLPKFHPNIVNILAAELHPMGVALMIFEHYSGGDLQQLLDKSRGELPLQLSTHVAVSVADALAFLHHGLIHEHGRTYKQIPHHVAVTHSDIKPDNIFLRVSGKRPNLPEIVLADFGCAVVQGEPLRGACPYFAAPELGALFSGRPTCRSDCYGVTIYEMVM